MPNLLDLLGVAFFVLAAALSIASVAVAVGLWLALLVASVWLVLAGAGCLVAATTKARKAAAGVASVRVAA
jgi:hypothetical protein